MTLPTPPHTPPSAPGPGRSPRPRRYRPPAWLCGELCGAAFGLYFGLMLVGLVLAVAPRPPGRQSGGWLALLVGGAPEAPMATPVPRPTASPPSLPAREAVLAAEAARLAQPAWRATETVSTDGVTYVQTLAFQAPDRYWLIQPGIAEIITIGQWAWLRQEGAWSVGQTGIQAVTAAAERLPRIALLNEALAAGVPFETRPARAIAGAAAHTYTWTVPSLLGETTPPAEVTLWVRQADSLPLRLRVRGNFAGRPQVTQVDYEYPPDLVIEPPPAPTPGPSPSPAAPLTTE